LQIARSAVASDHHHETEASSFPGEIGDAVAFARISPIEMTLPIMEQG
jgi:hypothetical protein